MWHKLVSVLKEIKELSSEVDSIKQSLIVKGMGSAIVVNHVIIQLTNNW